MLVPEEMVAIVAVFAPLFSDRVWVHAQVLVWGTLLARGPRTVASALRAMGKADERHWTNYHRVLNRAVWSGLAVAGTLLLLVLGLVRGTQVLVAIDDVLERRTGERIQKRGVYRDPLMSSRAHESKSPGLRWVVAAVLVRVAWSRRVWALPVLSVLAPPPPHQTRKSKAAQAAKKAGTPYLPPKRKRATPRVRLASRTLTTVEPPRQGVARRHKTTVDLAVQMLGWLARHVPARRIIAVVDGAYSAHKLVAGAVRRGVHLVTRLHWEAQLYEAPDPGSTAKLGARMPSPRQHLNALSSVWQEVEVSWYGGKRKRVFLTSYTSIWAKGGGHDAVAVRVVITIDPKPDRGKVRQECFLCTDLTASPEQIVEWFVLRWNEEVTFEEARRHLGIETQRQWSPKAIARATPALLGLFSLVTLMTHALCPDGKVPIGTAAWYDKREATFSDCLALIRREVLRARVCSMPPSAAGVEPIHAPTLDAILDALPLTA
jgi:hypothetical protein